MGRTRVWISFGLCLFGAAACAVQKMPDPVSIPLRNPTAPIASQADVSLDRLIGAWVVVAAAGLAPGQRLSFAPGNVTIDGVTYPVVEVGPGRFLLGDQMIWVHWLDGDNRTAAIGNPDGDVVWIMDRAGHTGERLAAAREILAWYGYDLTRLTGADG